MRQGDDMSDPRAAALLADPLRRALYDAVAAADEPIARDAAAAAAGVTANLAGYHLDQLEEAGLLEGTFARRDGRAGPGAGRPAKHYRATGVEVRLQVPARDDGFVAHLLATAIEADESGVAQDLLVAASRTAGSELGKGVASDRLVAALADRGYEPREETDGTVVLRNCPFHHLMPDHLELVCGMNLALLDAVVKGAKARYTAQLAPAPGRCCVTLTPGS
jgi:predicted ArsR family transcriptional regulator